MSNSHLSHKLRIKQASIVSVVGAPDEALNDLYPLPPEVQLSRVLQPNSDLVVVFSRHRAELEDILEPVLTALEPTGTLWLAYQKGAYGDTTDLKRDVLWEVGRQSGLRPVTQIAVNEVWTALRFKRTGEA